MKSSKIQIFLSKIFLITVINISNKIDVSSLKKIVDYLFEKVEDIIINFEKFIPSYLDYYVDLIDKEIKIGRIIKDSKVVHIGCGPLPSTSILISKKTGAEVLGIDKDILAVEKARDLISTLGSSDKIKIKHADAFDLNIEDFDVIIISHGLDNLYKFLENISESIDKRTIIVIRTFSNKNGELSKSDDFIKKLFKIDKIVNHKNHGSVISVSLMKK